MNGTLIKRSDSIDLRKLLVATAVIVFGFLAFIVLVPPRAGRKTVTEPEVASVTNLEEIQEARDAYAIDHHDHAPPSLEALVPKYLRQSSLVSPFNPADSLGYSYTPNLRDDAPNAAVMVEDKFAPSLKNERIVLYANGGARILPLAATSGGDQQPPR